MTRPPPPLRRSPWARLGLRGNPFRRLTGEELVASLLELTGPDDREAIRDWLARDADAVQFIGQEGWGKTTRLRACYHVASEEMRLPCRFDYVPVGTTRLAPPPGGEPTPRLWFIDEAQRLDRRSRERIAAWSAAGRDRLRVRPETPTSHRRDAGATPSPWREAGATVASGPTLILGTHESLTRDLEAAGLTVATIDLSLPGADEIGRFVRRRIALAHERKSDCPGSPGRLAVTDAAIRWLDADAGGNLGRAEYVLYEACQHAVETLPAADDQELVIDEPAIERAIQGAC